MAEMRAEKINFPSPYGAIIREGPGQAEADRKNGRRTGKDRITGKVNI